MAFITATPVSRSHAPLTSRRATSSRRRLSVVPAATAVQPNAKAPAQKKKGAVPRPRASAPVIDSRVASRHEAHHWVVVKDHSRRVFERAAVAQADVARQLETRQKSGASHRWVLREILDSLSYALPLSISQNHNSRYLVMESFDKQVWQDASISQHQHDSLTRRWLSAVERVGPLISAIDIRSLEYTDVFTSKLHDVVFDPKINIVILESMNVIQNKHDVDAVIQALRAKAERSVAVGECLEFCVLRSASQPHLFKTVEVYKNADALHSHMEGVDKKFMPSIRSHVVDDRRNRHIFKPVLFS